MEKFIIDGGAHLKGSVKISGAKNAVLPIMAACLLSRGKYIISNVPDLSDVRTMAHLLRIIGAEVQMEDGKLIIDTIRISFPEAPYELVKTMRASVYVLGPLVASMGMARVSLPGGCAWGPRPVDFHIYGLQKLGAQVDIIHGYIDARAKALRGTEIIFPQTSVGATGNVLMASVLAQGNTVIGNAAREPEILNLAEFLKAMGAEIEGQGTDTITVHGVQRLYPANFKVIPDRIETGTFLSAAAITHGDVLLENTKPEYCLMLLDKLKNAGVDIETGDSWIRVRAMDAVRGCDITTAPYPGFPTDMQAQLCALMCTASGGSIITDTIYSNRFSHVPELQRMGADIFVRGNSAVIKGMSQMLGAQVMATDIRASAALILAGLASEGETIISRIYHIDRGYEKIEAKLNSLGAGIQRIRDESKY